MRALVPLGVIILIALLVFLLARAFPGGPYRGRPLGNDATREPEMSWETHTEVGDGATTVAVRRMERTPSGPVERGRQVITVIADDDPEWETKYHAAMAEARSRAAALEIESD